MNQGKYVYSQLTDFLPKRVFDGLSHKCLGDRYIKHLPYGSDYYSVERIEDIIRTVAEID